MQMDESLLDNPEAFARFQEAQTGLGSALQRLLVITENYPDLKSNQNFLALQDQLEGTENRIAVERQRFNEAARNYKHLYPPVPPGYHREYDGIRPESLFRRRRRGRIGAQCRVLNGIEITLRSGRVEAD